MEKPPGEGSPHVPALHPKLLQPLFLGCSAHTSSSARQSPGIAILQLDLRGCKKPQNLSQNRKTLQTPQPHLRQELYEAPDANTALQQPFLLLVPKEPGSGEDLLGCLPGQMLLPWFTFGFLCKALLIMHLSLSSGEICHIPTLEMFFPPDNTL